MLEIQKYTGLPFAGVLLPIYDITPDQRVAVKAPANCSALDFITRLCRAGWKNRVHGKVPPEKLTEYTERVKMELDTIETLGFTNYILMVWDICRFADLEQIPRGPGRGSVSSSLVCYLLSITDVDPIENGLFFTRFLSKSRAKKIVENGVTYVDGGLVADIDLDFGFADRHRVIQYINNRYPGQTSQLLTVRTFSSRILIKDILKVYENASEEEAKVVSEIIQDDTGIPVSIEKSMFGDEKHQKGEESDWPPNEQFVEWAEDHKESVGLAMDLEGLNAGEGMHASAVAICAMPINQLIPTQLSSSKEGEKVSLSGYDMYDLQELALKFDVLGLKCLDVLSDCTKATGVNWRHIDINDPAIYEQLKNFQRRYGIFQLETWAQGSAAQKVKPRNFGQLSAVLAIARPGAIAYLQQFADYVNEDKFTSIHPLIDDILKPTGGICAYQEEYLAMLVRIGMHADRAENARKVLGKKLKEKVPEVIAEIEEVCGKNGHPKEIVDLLVKIAYDAGGYSFSAAHARAYSKLTAATLYYKVHHPLEFYWANLQMIRHESERYEKLAVVDQELRELGITLLPPRLSLDGMDFKIEGKNIRCALGMVRGVSNENEQKLALFIDKSGLSPASTKFEVFQAMKNAKLNVAVGSALIQAGCMSDYDSHTDSNGVTSHSRSRLVLEWCLWSRSDLLSAKERAKCLQIEKQANSDVLRAVQLLATEIKDEKGNPFVKATRFETIKKRYLPYKEIYLQNSRNERLANFWYEKTVLGYSHSESLKGIFEQHTDGLVTTEEAKKLPDGSRCRLIGFVSEPIKGKTKKGNDELRFRLNDEIGEVRIKVFNDRIGAIETQNKRQLENGDIVIANCKKMQGGTFFAEAGVDGTVIGIQTAKIFMKLAEIRDAKADKEEVK